MEGYLTVQEVLNKYITGCVAKMQMTMGRLFGKAILAGMMIALGACASSVAAHTIPDVGLARLAAAVVFPVGLMMVVLLGGELFTGDCLAAMSIFDGTHKFSNSSSPDKGRSLGIGLFVCKTIIEAHGGKISASNAPEGGACFSFTLPIGGDSSEY